MVDFGPDILDTEVPEAEPLDVDISSEPQHELAMTLSSGAVRSSSPVVFDFSLQSRVEVILNAIINDLVYGEHPKSRVEQILLYILGEANELPTPHSRVEELLIDLALELESTDISPKSRVEQILLVLLNQPYEFPITHSRVEELLVQLQKHVSEVTGPLPLTINTDGTELIDYRIYGNTENGESVGEKTENLFDKNATIDGYEITGSGISVNNSWYISDFIPVRSNVRYRGIGISNSVLLYKSKDDQSPIFRSGIAASNGFLIPDDYNFIIVNAPKTVNKDIVMLTELSKFPTEYIPYGCKLSMVSRTENLYDYHNDNFGYFNVDGQIRIVTGYPQSWSHSEYISVMPGVKYIALGLGIASSPTYCCIYDKNKNLIDTVQNKMPNTEINVPYDGAYVRLSIRRSESEYLTAEFISATDTPIYIGATKLAKDEYVSFSEGKIYKKVNGTLTPTTPPVSLPALPTIKGETTIEYDGGEPQPKQMYVKYNES